MTRSYPALLVLLAALWGSQYVFIRVAVRDLAPATMIDLRLWIAAPIIVAYVLWSSGVSTGWHELRSAARPSVVLGVLNAVPFTLVAWGEQHVDSGVAAIGNATVPIFVVALVVKAVPSERVTGLRLAGVVLGLIGVAVLAGLHPRAGWWSTAGTAAVVAASLSFALSQVYSRTKIELIRGPVLAAGAMSTAALLLLPFALVQPPTDVPSWKVIGSVVALAVLGTAAAQLLFYRMIGLHGVSRTTLVSYLIPVAGLLFGATILGEPLTVAKLLGLALILAGVALGAGVVRRRRRTPRRNRREDDVDLARDQPGAT